MASSWSELVQEVLADNRKLLKFLAACVVLAVLVVGVAVALMKFLGINTSQAEQVEMDAGQAKFVLRLASSNKTLAQYVVVIHPQGWQDSGISVHSGDKLRFRAAGSVNIDLEGVISKVELRKKYEAEVTRSKKLDRNSDDPKNLPERYYSEKQLQDLRVNRPWTGPDGNLEKAYTSYRARIPERIMPERPVGALLGALPSAGKNPQASDAFFVGTSFGDKELVAPADGELWFIVNDVWNKQNPQYENMFFEDNIGSFWVVVSVTNPKVSTK